MPDGMPYYVEKGRYFSLLDSLSEQPKELLLSFRNELDSGTSVQTVASGLTPPQFQGDFGQHLADDWFGSADPAQKRTTGWWLAYKGNVEEVMRETLIRAIDVSLGIDRSVNTATPADTTRHWPVQFLWVCGSRWFEGWVNWHTWDPGAASTLDVDDALTQGGIVTVMFVTPGMKDEDGKAKEMYHRPQRPPPNGANYEDDPNSAVGNDHGMWVVSAASHEPHLTGVGIGIGWNEDGGEVAVPKFFSTNEFVDGGPVVVVSPSEVDGGVLHGGRNY